MSTTEKSRKMLRQVTLRRDVNMYYQEDVVWIDNALAVVGKRVRDEEGRIWKVWEVHNAKPFDDVDKQREAWKRWADVLDGH